MKTLDIPHVILYSLALVVGSFLVYMGKLPASAVFPVLGAWLVTPSAGASLLRVLAGGSDSGSGSVSSSSGSSGGATPKPPSMSRLAVFGFVALIASPFVVACASLAKDAKTAEADAPVVIADVDTEVTRLQALAQALRVLLADAGGMNKAAADLARLKSALDAISSTIPVLDAGAMSP